MIVKKESVRNDTVSCNFCQKGELNRSGNNLIYPYDTVYTFKRDTGNGLCATICKECLKELHDKANHL